jgi:hypothetical protein
MASIATLGQNMVEEISEKLSALEKRHEIKILLACEVGSRAWGLDNANSDYDVKFIYVRRLNWYLGIEEVKRDLIDDNSDFDMNGWDIRKALQLLRESNCGILEWLNSKLLYKCEPAFLERAQRLSAETHCRRSLLLAYWGKAGKHYKEYILVEMADGTVLLKKYLFIIQALLSARWIFAFSPNGTDLPPHDFATLLDSFTGSSYKIEESIYALAHELMTKKRAATLGNGLRYKNLDKWIESSLVELETKSKAVEKKSRDNIQPFNTLFVEMATMTSGFSQAPGASYFEQIGMAP